MAKLVAKIVGGNPQNVVADTVGDVKRQLGVSAYQANLNGSPASDTASVKDDDFITLSPAVKGGII